MRPAVAFLAMCCAVRAGAQGTLTGHVREASGLGIAGADVQIVGGFLRAITDTGGAFRFRGVPAPAASVTVRRIGFRLATREIVVADGAMVDLTIVLEPLPVQLQRVTVTERRVAVDQRLAGFRERMRTRPGHFLTRERIDALHPMQFTDLLRGIPSVRIGPVRGTGIRNSVRLRGSSCWPIVFLDGFAAAAAEFDLDAIDPASVEAVEIYMGPATAPTELMGPRGGDRCGVIGIWTRLSRPPGPPPAVAAERGKLARLVEGSSVYSADAVDSAARMDSTTFLPAYPDSLWLSGVAGTARVEFVVDADGEIEWEFFNVVSTSNPAFGNAVRTALEHATFEPAMKAGKRVRQVLHLAVRFERPKLASPPPGVEMLLVVLANPE